MLFSKTFHKNTYYSRNHVILRHLFSGSPVAFIEVIMDKDINIEASNNIHNTLIDTIQRQKRRPYLGDCEDRVSTKALK